MLRWISERTGIWGAYKTPQEAQSPSISEDWQEFSDDELKSPTTQVTKPAEILSEELTPLLNPIEELTEKPTPQQVVPNLDLVLKTSDPLPQNEIAITILPPHLGNSSQLIQRRVSHPEIKLPSPTKPQVEKTEPFSCWKILTCTPLRECFASFFASQPIPSPNEEELFGRVLHL